MFSNRRILHYNQSEVKYPGHFIEKDIRKKTRLLLIPVNTKHLYNISTMLAQHRRRWADNHMKAQLRVLTKIQIVVWYLKK